VNGRARAIIGQQKLPSHGLSSCQASLTDALGIEGGFGDAYQSGPGWTARGFPEANPTEGIVEGDIIIYKPGDRYNGVVRGVGREHVGIAGMHNGRMMLWSHMGTSWKWTEIGQFSELHRQPGDGRGVRQYDAPAGPPLRTSAPVVSMGSREQTIQQARTSAEQAQRQAAVTYERRRAASPSGGSVTVTVPVGQNGSYTKAFGGVEMLVRYWADGRVKVEAR